MILLLVVITIAVSISCEFISTAIYFIVVRPELSRLGVKLNFDWLPNKRKKIIVEHKEQIAKSNIAMLTIWLDTISWVFLIISSLLVLYMVMTQT